MGQARRKHQRRKRLLFTCLAACTLGALTIAGAVVLSLQLAPPDDAPAATNTAGSTAATPAAPTTAQTTATEIRRGPRKATDEIPVLLQNPELPTGCEATVATMLLQAYGFTVSKTQMAASLPVSELEMREDGRRYAAHPNEAFVGVSPAVEAAYGVYSAPVASTMQMLIDRYGGGYTAVDISGSTQADILACVDSGAPVAIWVTIGLVPTVDMYGWYIKRGDIYTDEYYAWPGNEHCMLLTGYTDTQVTVHDPLRGKRNYDRQLFFQRYEEQERHAIVIR